MISTPLKGVPMFKTTLMMAGLLLGISLSGSGQTEKDKWQRVYSGEDSVITGRKRRFVHRQFVFQVCSQPVPCS